MIVADICAVLSGTPCNLVSVLSSSITNPKSGTQPDSCLVRYDPFKLRMSTEVYKPFMNGQDHSMINIKFETCERIPQLCEYKNVFRETFNKDANCEKILQEEFRSFVWSYRDILGWSKQGYPENKEWKKIITDNIVEYATQWRH